MSIWGELQIRIEPWEPDFGGGVAFEDFRDVDADTVDLDPEVAADDWAPIPGEGAAFERVVFIDGVRRIDARILALHEGKIVHGIFGSYGVGAVEMQDGRATVSRNDIDRIVVTGSGHRIQATVEPMPNLRYRPQSADGGDLDDSVRVLQTEMRRGEARIAEQFIAEDTLVVADGPLVFDTPVEGIVGFVKRIFDPYLPATKAALLAALPAGHRTPIFALRSNRRYSRYAWFLRLSEPELGQSPFAGVVRLEVVENAGIDRAVEVANQTTELLPTLASSRSYDPRAPQNLIPIGGLESKLKHMLGDAALIRRHIEGFIAREAKND